MSNEHMDSEHPQKIDLIELLRGLLRSARHMLFFGIVLMVVGAAAMGFLTHIRYKPSYQASASFTVRMVNPLYSSQQYYNSSVAEQMAKTFPQILTSGILSEQVKEELGISYMPSVKASALGETNVITITVTANDPQLAYDVLNCVTELYPSVSEFVVGPTTMTVLSESGVPTEPTSRPDYVKAAVYGLVGGGALWAGLSALYWLTHQTANNEKELGKIINVPCLGTLPKVKGQYRKGNCPIISDKNDKFGFNESVRLLRVRAEKALGKNGGKVLMVTSTIPNEGKTTVSVNLATALAQKGKKTLLVDCDLRNPSVGKIYNMDNHVGFSEFLKGECSLKEALFEPEEGNLSVILGGSATANPEKLLTHSNTAVFMNAARESFDYVILDTPPCALMADAAEIGELSDGILLTVRQDFACRRQIIEGVQALNEIGKPILGCVLNMTVPQLGKDSYYSYYGYGYGYGYGYHGSDKDEDEAEE